MTLRHISGQTHRVPLSAPRRSVLPPQPPGLAPQAHHDNLASCQNSGQTPRRQYHQHPLGQSVCPQSRPRLGKATLSRPGLPCAHPRGHDSDSCLEKAGVWKWGLRATARSTWCPASLMVAPLPQVRCWAGFTRGHIWHDGDATVSPHTEAALSQHGAQAPPITCCHHRVTRTRPTGGSPSLGRSDTAPSMCPGTREMLSNSLSSGETASNCPLLSFPPGGQPADSVPPEAEGWAARPPQGGRAWRLWHQLQL